MEFLSFTPGGVRSGFRSIGVLLAFFGALAIAGVAQAGVGVGMTPTFPSTVKVGQTNVPASLQIAWANSPSNDTHANNITNITLVPCGEFVAAANCPSAPTDQRLPGLFTLSAAGTGVGCGAVTNFTISVIDAPSGKVEFTPGFELPVSGVCTISFTLNVNAAPTKDADPVQSGFQVAILGGASATDAVNGQPGSGLGTAEASFPQISTVPGAGGTLGVNGVPAVNLSDSATLVGLAPDNNNNPPTGTVTFSLYAPTDPTCVNPPFQSQTVNLSNIANCTINGTSFLTSCNTTNLFTANAAGVWHWTASYSGDPLNVSLLSGCAEEPVTVNKATPTLQTSPNPPSGTLLATPLGDVADLQGGYFPTGVIVFRLYPPSDPNCSGTQAFINARLVNGNGQYSTSLNLQKALVNQVGTWHWRANYSGDDNNNAVESPCAAEPVQITQPVLQIAKTPDGATIIAGATATFTIVLTNLGPGVAKDVVISDALPAGGALNWQTSTIGCNVTGAPGSRTLTCNLGVNFIEGATFTAVVTAVTSNANCGVLNNTAIASGSNAVQVSNGGQITCRVLANPTLVTTPVPTSGTLLATPLGDSANLQNGDAPTGVIVFRLYPPSDPTCAGTQAFINAVPVNGNGIYTTSLNYQKALVNQTGTWHWRANYSGDANNNPAASTCASEPVVITQPVLQIAKTPDNGTIIAGATATFTIVLTNLGPGVAKDVTISDPLPAGGGVNWQTSTAGCTVTGAINAQTLNCNLGVNFAQGATFTAVVTAATTTQACTVMNNTATASGTNVVAVNDTGKITCSPPQQTGVIAHTDVACNDYLNIGPNDLIGQINYSASNGTIGQGINPGQFYYYTTITTTVPNQVVTVTQTHTGTAAEFEGAMPRTYTLGCDNAVNGTMTNGDTDATFTIPVPGTYVLSIKYGTKSIAGTPAPVPDDITYSFVTSLGPLTGASVLLKEQ